MGEQEAAKPADRLAAVSEVWMSAWLRPWTALNVWNEYWRDQWKTWLAGKAAAPAAWLPALAEERFDQPETISFFLPWLPRLDARVVPLESHGDDEAMRLMLRAALPRVGAFGPAEWLTVDATIRHSAGAVPPQLTDDNAAPVIDAPPATPKRPRATLHRMKAVTEVALPVAQKAAPSAAESAVIDTPASVEPQTSAAEADAGVAPTKAARTSARKTPSRKSAARKESAKG